MSEPDLRSLPLLPARPRRSTPSPISLAGSAFMVVAASACAHTLSGVFPTTSLALIFLVAVLISAVTFGFWTGLVAAGLAFLAYNFFFVEPLFTLRVTHAEDMLALAVFLFVAGLTGLLAGRLREEADAARKRADLLEQLSQFVAELADITSIAEIEKLLLGRLAQLGAGAIIVVSMDESGLATRLATPADTQLSIEDLQAADRALRHGATEQAAAAGWAGSRFSFHPLWGAGALASVVGIRVAGNERAQEQAIVSTIKQARSAGERLRFASEAVEARHKAEREAIRSALLSSLSHDLKTPLATILGSVTTLRQFAATLPEAAREDLLSAIEEDTRRLSGYVANLLHMTRLQAGLDLRLDWIDPNDVLNGAVSQARRIWPDRAIAMTTAADAGLIHADAALLQQGLFNIIDNALKHSSRELPVQARTLHIDNGLRFEIDDGGPGVATAEQTSIFEPFVRGASKSTEGTGLGLAITKGIVHALGGVIGIDSPLKQNRGARFWINLPARAVAQP